MTAKRLNWFVFFLGMTMLWITTHNWTAMFWAFIASLNFTLPSDEETREKIAQMQSQWRELRSKVADIKKLDKSIKYSKKSLKIIKKKKKLADKFLELQQEEKELSK